MTSFIDQALPQHGGVHLFVVYSDIMQHGCHNLGRRRLGDARKLP
jgi:hypothetical protein